MSFNCTDIDRFTDYEVRQERLSDAEKFKGCEGCRNLMKDKWFDLPLMWCGGNIDNPQECVLRKQ